MSQSPSDRNNLRKKRIGIVTSDKMQKTIVVQVKHKVRHPLVGKVIERAKKYKAHDEMNEAKTGDKVLIQETRPISRDKNWRLVEILEKGRGKVLRKQSSSSDVKDALDGLPEGKKKVASPVATA